MPFMQWVAVASIVSFGVLFARTDSQPVTLANEPHHHPVLANDFVRVFHVKVAPHDSTLLHKHDRDYVMVQLTSSDISNTPFESPGQQLHVEPGEAQLVKAPLIHVVRNDGETPYANISVEILRSSPLHPPGAVAAGNFGGDGTVTKLLFENDVVRAWDTEIQPGGTQAHHVHQLPYLAIAVTDLSLKNVPDKGSPSTISHKAGEVVWMNAPYGHTLTNMSDHPARFISLEFK